MKPNIKKIALFAVVSSGFTAVSHAAEISTPGGTEQTISIQIATHQTVDGTYAKDETGKTITPKETTDYNEWSNSDDTVHNQEFVTKIQTVKYGNKQILEDFVADGIIPSITGWSIKLIWSFDEGDSEPFLVKKDTPPIWIGDLLALNEGSASASGEKSTRVINDTKETDTQTGSSHWLSLVNVSLNLPSEDISFSLTGLDSGSDHLKKIGDSYEWINDSETIKVIGSADAYSEDDDRVAEGTLKLSGATVLEDISGYTIQLDN